MASFRMPLELARACQQTLEGLSLQRRPIIFNSLKVMRLAQKRSIPLAGFRAAIFLREFTTFWAMSNVTETRTSRHSSILYYFGHGLADGMSKSVFLVPTRAEADDCRR